MASATASASGGNGTDSSGNSTDGDSSVDSKIAGQANDASTKQSDAGVGSGEQQSAGTQTAAGESGDGSTNEGKVAVAAAIAVDVGQSSVSAYVPIAVGVSAQGGLTVATVNNTDGVALADGSAVGAAQSSSGGSSGGSGGSKVGIGAAVGIVVVTETNDATLGSAGVTGQAYTAGGLTAGHYDAESLSVSALKTNLGVPTAENFSLRDGAEPLR